MQRTRPSNAPTPSSPAAQPRPPRGCSGLTPARSWGNRGAPRTHCGVSRSPGRWGVEARLPPSRVSRRVSPAGAEMTVRSGKSGFRRRRSKNPKWRHRRQTSRAIGSGANARPRGPLVTEGAGQTGRLPGCGGTARPVAELGSSGSPRSPAPAREGLRAGLGLCACARARLWGTSAQCARVHPGFRPSSFWGLPKITPTASGGLGDRAVLVNA